MAVVSEEPDCGRPTIRIDMVRAVKEVKKMKGGSQSHLFECDDGRFYVVKFNDGTKNVTNEFVGSEVAHALQLPAPRHALVEIDQQLIENNPDLKQRNILAGIHHGTVFEEKALDLEARNLEPTTIKIENSTDIPGVIAFDNLMVNTDRNNTGNNLFLQSSSAASYTYMMCDYNCIFSGNSWNAQTLASIVSNTNLMAIHPALANAITGVGQFESAFTRIEQLQISTTQTIINSIPSTWTISFDERIALVNFVEARKSKVREIILKNTTAFPRWVAEPVPRLV